MIAELKKELTEKISATEDENLLMVLKDDFEELAGQAKGDVTDHLSEEDRNELKEMINEPFGHDTISMEEFDKKIKEWRTGTLL